MRLEELTKGVSVKGLASRGLAEIVSADWLGEGQLHVFFRSDDGPQERILSRSDEERLEASRAVRPFSFTADAEDFRLAAEARRIRLAHLFDPYLALTTSPIEALPHQITAVYGEMLPRQPLRFLLADDPGAGKTIMAGLFIKELMLRGDLKRCLIVAPGSLVEQWEDELREKFDLRFHIVSRDMIESSYHGNPFREHDRLILRLDMASRSEEMQTLIDASSDFDLVIVDEAHRMSASYFGNEVKRTKRFLFGQRLGQNARHLLLMTATPHNGKEEEFQLFLSLLDHDRFEGRPREGVRAVRPTDLMRRLVKEELYWFDGRPLFPDRHAYTVSYQLSAAEAQLYSAVTDYVREEMNRADRVGEGAARNNVGFALMSLQRRLASSPRAIWISLKRRRERLQARLEEEQIKARGQLSKSLRGSINDFEPADIEEMPEEELEGLENEAIDTASSARTLDELTTEIASLKDLEESAYALCRSGDDAKWAQLAQILNQPPVHDPETGRQKKILIFTEPRDTLEYLQEKISTRLGDPDAVKVIHGGVARQQRRAAVAAFNDDPRVRVLIANDAAGEGVNLQRGAHLMVNYDLPWNPNRLEQRFGRIHRIGQTEVCHLWNLVAGETREGAVYQRLLEKLEEARKSLGGKVYDVLGELFVDVRLQDLLFEAVRKGESEEVRAKLFQVVEGAVDQDRLNELTKRAQLSSESLSPARVEELRQEMERAAAQRLQPHYVRAFFMEAFRRQGGIAEAREEERWEVTRVPARVRLHDHAAGSGDPVLERYHRVCFDKAFRKPGAQDADAALVAPGHPLLEAVTDLAIEELGAALREGAVLVDENDWGQTPKLLIMAEHAIKDGREVGSGPRVISQQLQFVYLKPDGSAQMAGPAPYLDLRALKDEERPVAEKTIEADWLTGDLNARAVQFAARTLVPEHLEHVRERRLTHLKKVEDEVRDRLHREIRHWDARANKHRQAIMGGRDESLALRKAEGRANELGQRLEMRLAEIERERDIGALPPRVLGGALVVPIGLIAEQLAPAKYDGFAEETAEVELIAMQAVMDAERAAGRTPVDVSALNRGWDIESFTAEGKMVLLEVKGRIVGGRDVIVTRNEMLKARNAGRQYHLAVVQVENGFARQPAYVSDPARHFWFEGEFRDTCRHYALKDLLAVSAAQPDLTF